MACSIRQHGQLYWHFVLVYWYSVLVYLYTGTVYLYIGTVYIHCTCILVQCTLLLVCKMVQYCTVLVYWYSVLLVLCTRLQYYTPAPCIAVPCKDFPFLLICRRSGHADRVPILRMRTTMYLFFACVPP